MRNRIEIILNTIVAACALAVAGTLIFDRLSEESGDGARLTAIFEPEWAQMTAEARWIGPEEARVTIVEFTDYQCPFCAIFHETVKTLRSEFGDRIALAVVPFPLDMHRHAAAAAIAAECAGQTGRFAEMSDELFRAQDSIGTVTWTEFAIRAGVGDSATFETCVGAASTDTLKSSARTRAERYSVTATPTVVVNGWRFSIPPPPDTLRRVISDILAERKPYR